MTLARHVQDSGEPSDGTPLRLFTAALILALLSFGILFWTAWQSHLNFEGIIALQSELGQAGGSIGRLDEALTMSARMAASSGDPLWETRYLSLEPQLDAAIGEARRLAPDLFTMEAASQTDQANRRLVEMEHRAFALVRQGQRAAATALLDSAEYKAEEQVYATGLWKLLTAMNARGQARLAVERKRLSISFGIQGVALTVLVLAWLAGLRAARRHDAERRRAEVQLREHFEALRESEERIRMLVESSGEAILLTEPQGEIYAANAEACRTFGRSEAEILQVGRNGLVDLDDPRLKAALVTRQETGGFKGELNFRRKDGTVFPGELSSAVFQGSDGRKLTSMIIRDISERKRAEDEIQHQRDLLSQVMEASPVGIVMLSQEGRLVFANAHAERLLGLTTENLEGRTYNAREWHITDVSGGEFSPEQLPFRQVITTGRPVFDVRHTIEGSGGRRVLLSINAAPLMEGGEISGVIAALEDITDRKRTEEKLRQADLEREKTQSAEAVAQIIQGLAHEVRNPLFAINVNAAVIEKKASAVPDVAENIAFVKEHVDRLNALMRDLMELGRQPLAGEVIECRLRDVAGAAALAAEAQAPDAAGRVFVEAPERPFTVSALPERLQSVLVHLILNALQNSPANGRVWVRAGQSGGHAFVEVVDEGPGIPVEIRARVFEPFVTAHKGRRGLGLALSKHYVTAMGGTLEAANNDPPPGSTFTVRLPLV